MSFGLEIALNAWLPGYFARGFHNEIAALGFTGVAGLQIAAGTFAAVESFNASLFRPFAGFMSDLFQRKGWTPLPFIAKELPYAPRLHWLGIALILITVSMAGLTIAGLYGSLPLSVVTLMALGIFISFGTGGTFALVPLLFPDRPGIAAGFVGGVSTFGGHRLSADLRRQRQHAHRLSVRRALHVRAVHPVLLLGRSLRAAPAGARLPQPQFGWAAGLKVVMKLGR
jgi:MFS transporter, NNP family, nitrate/nitrite transporter